MNAVIRTEKCTSCLYVWSHTCTLLNIATLVQNLRSKIPARQYCLIQTRSSAADDISRQREHTLWRCGHIGLSGIARYLRAVSHKWSADRQEESKLNPIPVQCVADSTLKSNNVQEFKTNTVKMPKLKEISYKNQLRNCQQWRCVDYYLRVD